jgi:hypothetical protein
MRRGWLGFVQAGLVAAMMLGNGQTAQSDELKAARSIHVAAVGQAKAQPDMARMGLGVVSEAAQARSALAATALALQKVVAGLKAAGIAPADIQTTHIGLDPRYGETKGNRPPEVVGYRAGATVAFISRDLAGLGELLDKAATLGANQMHGIRFDVSKAAALRDEARANAVAQATQRARLYAEAAGVQLGAVLRIEEVEGEAAPRGMVAARAMAADVMPIEAGTQVIEVQVRMTFAIQ